MRVSARKFMPDMLKDISQKVMGSNPGVVKGVSFLQNLCLSVLRIALSSISELFH